MKAYQAFATLEHHDRFLGWCGRIARNTWTDLCRRSSHPTVPLTEIEVPDQGDFVEELVDDAALREALAGFLSALGPRPREVFEARVSGVPSKELGLRLNVPAGAIDSIVSRVRTRGREMLTALIESGALVLGPIIPRRVKSWWRRQVGKIADLGRRAEMFGSAQLGAAIAAVGIAAVVVAGGITIATSQFQGGARPNSSVRAPATTAASSVTDGATPHGAVGPGVVWTARSVDAAAASADGCALVLQCSDGPGGRFKPAFGDRPQPGDTSISVWIPGAGWLFLDTTPHRDQIPSSPNDLQHLLLGRPDGLKCDERIVTDGRTCDGRDAPSLVLFLAELTRRAAVGDECQINDQHGTHIPVACDPVSNTRKDR